MTKADSEKPEDARPEVDVGVPHGAREYGAIVSFRMPLDELMLLDRLIGADENPRIRSEAIRMILRHFIDENRKAAARSKPQRIG